MGNCLSKYALTLPTPPLASGHQKKVVRGIQKSFVKDFATSIHQNYRYERFTQSIINSPINMYDRFASQYFER